MKKLIFLFIFLSLNSSFLFAENIKLNLVPKRTVFSFKKTNTIMIERPIAINIFISNEKCIIDSVPFAMIKYPGFYILKNENCRYMIELNEKKYFMVNYIGKDTIVSENGIIEILN